MSAPVPPDSPDDRKSTRPLSRRLATATTRAILIAIVAGGLLTVALNLSQLASSTAVPPNHSWPVALAVEDWESGLPITQAVVLGNEADARMAAVQAIQQELETILDLDRENPNVREGGPPGWPGTEQASGTMLNDVREVARDPDHRWSIREIDDWRRRLVGVSLADGSPTLRAWGGYDEIGPGEWQTWIVRLSKSGK